MTVIEEKSVKNYVLSRRFITFLVVCVCLAAGLGYLYRISGAVKESPDYSIGNGTQEVIIAPEPITTELPGKPDVQVDNWRNKKEIQIFRDYLRIRTDHPNINYEPCVKFLQEQAKNLDLPVSIYYPVNKENPVVVMTWLGSQPDLSSIVLNSHMDVVPTFNEYWSYPPFAAEVDEFGNIFARGAQDAKCIGMQYLAAIRALKSEGVKQLKRTVHVFFVPDEEMGSDFGMRQFVHSDPFKAMNVGFTLDEGVASESGDNLKYYFAERASWRMEFICRGKSGHGSIMFENTAAEKLYYLIGKFTELRKIEAEKNSTTIQQQRNITSINLTVIKGGLEGNVVPPEMSAIFDVRLAVDADHEKFEQQINRWCEEAGGNITIKFHTKDPKGGASIKNFTNPYWIAFMNSTKSLDLIVEPAILSAASDSRFMRSVGIPAFGFSPMLNTTIKLHDNDEYLNEAIYLNGINIYKKIITSLANID